jgi:hypothetical protein
VNSNPLPNLASTVEITTIYICGAILSGTGTWMISDFKAAALFDRFEALPNMDNLVSDA